MDETEKRRQQRRQILANGGDPFKETVSQDFVVVVYYPGIPDPRSKKGTVSGSAMKNLPSVPYF
jgi:hypothetical protein